MKPPYVEITLRGEVIARLKEDDARLVGTALADMLMAPSYMNCTGACVSDSNNEAEVKLVERARRKMGSRKRIKG